MSFIMPSSTSAEIARLGIRSGLGLVISYCVIWTNLSVPIFTNAVWWARDSLSYKIHKYFIKIKKF